MLVPVKLENKFGKMALVKAFGLPALLTKTFQSLTLSQNRVLSTSTNLGISVTPVAFGMPTKRKKKADPMEIRKKEEKRKLRLKKALRKLGKKERLPKPLSSDSIEPPLHLLKQRDIRSRKVCTIYLISFLLIYVFVQRKIIHIHKYRITNCMNLY